MGLVALVVRGEAVHDQVDTELDGFPALPLPPWDDAVGGTPVVASVEGEVACEADISAIIAPEGALR